MLIYTRLRSCNGPADLTTLLPGVQSAVARVVCLLYVLGGLDQDQLNVAGVRHVRVDLDSISECWCGYMSVHTRP
jgi:hypothetical protein